MPKRCFSNWVDGFLEYTADFPTKPNFARWAGISTVAAALQRRTWTRIIRRRQYGNMYILLIGPPGSGKSVAIEAARTIAAKVHGINLTPTRITQAAFYQELANAGKGIVEIKDSGIPTDLNIHHSLTAMLSEFGIFVKRGDLDFMVDLADLFDCPANFEYKTKTQGVDLAPNACFNMVGACTERYLKETFTSDALEQGFPARIVMVHEDEPIDGLDIFGGEGDDDYTAENIPGDKHLFDCLRKDLEQMLLVHSNFTWSPEAQEFLLSWYEKKLKPYPMDPKLAHYNTRRLTHYSKLALIGSIARSNTQVITLQDAQWAKKEIINVEKNMHNALKYMGDNKYIGVMHGIINYVLTQVKETKRAVPEHSIRQIMSRDVPVYYVAQILDGLVAEKSLIVITNTAPPNRKFRPGERFKKRLEEERDSIKKTS